MEESDGEVTDDIDACDISDDLLHSNIFAHEYNVSELSNGTVAIQPNAVLPILVVLIRQERMDN